MSDNVTDLPVHRPTRDWIAVEQQTQRLLSTAPDERERRAIRLALDSAAAPDPDQDGGGTEWIAALTRARTHIQDVLDRELAQPMPFVIDNLDTIRAELTQALTAVDPTGALTEHATLIAARHLALARQAEREHLAGWLRDRADLYGATQTENAADVLTSAADQVARPPAAPPVNQT